MGRRPRGQIIITHVSVLNSKGEIAIFPLDSEGRLNKDENFYEVLKRLSLRTTVNDKISKLSTKESIDEEIEVIEKFDCDYDIDEYTDHIEIELDF